LAIISAIQGVNGDGMIASIEGFSIAPASACAARKKCSCANCGILFSNAHLNIPGKTSTLFT
jgi:hypothetical protein